MFLMITKESRKLCAATVLAGAMFLCGINGSALTVLASEGGGTASGNATLNSSYTTGPIADTSKNVGRDNVQIDKTLIVRNVVNTQNGGFTPSVPDVKFEYTTNFTNGWYINGNAGKKDYEVVVAQGVDSQGTRFNIWRGPAGSLKFGATYQNGKDTGEIIFAHADAVKDGAVKKTVAVSIDGKAFYRPGVYRYVLIEKMVEVDFSETDKEAAKVTDDIELRPTLLEKEGTTTDISGVTDNSTLQERRFLDVYVAWTPHEDGLMVTDVVLHDIVGDLIYDELDKQDQTYSRPQFNPDGTIKRGDDGIILYESNDPENKYADPYDMENILSGSKKTGFSDSIYTTYDLVIGKEIMGKGLTNYDLKERKFKFVVELEAPAGTTLRTYQNVSTSDVTRADVKTDEATGKQTVTFELLQGQVALISGLPAGSKYSVEEVNNTEKDGEPDTLEIFETYYAANNMEKILLTPAHWTGNLEDQAARNAELMKRQTAYAKEKADNGGTMTAEQEEAAGLVLKDKTGEYRIEKMTDEDVKNEKSVNHVFFLNLRYDNVVTGVALSAAPYVLMILAAVAGGGIYMMNRKKDDEEEIDDLDEV